MLCCSRWGAVDLAVIGCEGAVRVHLRSPDSSVPTPEGQPVAGAQSPTVQTRFQIFHSKDLPDDNDSDRES